MIIYLIYLICLVIATFFVFANQLLYAIIVFCVAILLALTALNNRPVKIEATIDPVQLFKSFFATYEKISKDMQKKIKKEVKNGRTGRY